MIARVLRTVAAAFATVLIVGVAFGASAQAFPYLGISQAYMDFGVDFTPPDRADVSAYKSWARLRIKTLRVVVPWDMGYRASTNDRKKEFQHWLERIRQMEIKDPSNPRDDVNIEPYVVLAPTEINASQGVVTRTASTPPEPVVPPAATYKAAVKKFLEVWGPGGTEPNSGRTAPVRTLGAWNEPNLADLDMSIPGGVDGPIHLPTQSFLMSDSSCPSSATPSNCGPLMAATYWKEARDEMKAKCASCDVVAGEFSNAWGPTDSHAKPYWEEYAHRVDTLINENYPPIISFHGHHDVEALDGSGDCRSGAKYGNCLTYRFANWLGTRHVPNTPWDNRSVMKIWNTEVHAEFAKGLSSQPDAGHAQLDRIKHLVSISDTFHVRRIYYYNYQNQTGIDRGLIAQKSEGSGVRPAWRYFKKRLLKCRPKQKHCKRPEASANTAALMAVGEGTPEGGEYDPALEPEDTLEPEEPEGGWSEPDSAQLDAVDMDVTTTTDNPQIDDEGASEVPESDVDGDGFADLVTLHASGTAFVYPGGYDDAFQPSFDTGVPSFAGTMDPAQYDGVGHYVVDVSDVNGDFLSDLVTLTASGTACVYPGQDDNTFSPTCIQSFAGTMSPGILNAYGKFEPIAVADVTGDGRDDMVAYHNTEHTIYVYPGTASGTFGTRVGSLVGSANSALLDGAGDYFVDVADVTGDGKADLVAQNTNGNAEVYPAQGSGSGAFSGVVTSFSGGMPAAMASGSGFEPIAVADVNGDGRADMVAHYTGAGSPFDKNVRVYLGQANGTFGSAIDSFSNTMNSALFDNVGHEIATVIDVNGDGLGDLVTANHVAGDVDVYPGTESGTFAPMTPNFAGTFASAQFHKWGHQIAMEKPARRRNGCPPLGCTITKAPESDVNGDKRSDLVTLHSTGTAFTYPGTIGLTFGASTASFAGTMDPAQYDGTGHYVVDLSDVNGDGRADLVTLHSNGSAYVYMGQVNGGYATAVSSFAGTMSPAILTPTPGKFEPIGVADVTGDGKGDFVVYHNTDHAIYVYPGQAAGTFGTRASSLVGSADSAIFDRNGDYFLDAADVTGDGKADLVAMNTNGSAEVYPAQSSGSGVFGGVVTSFSGTMPPSMSGGGSGFEPVAVADVNGDRRADLVTHYAMSGSPFDKDERVYLGQANGTFAVPAVESFANTMDSSLFDNTGRENATVMDVDGDGFGDLVTANHTNGNVDVYPGAADGTFGPSAPSFAGTFVSAQFNQAGHQIAMEKPARRRNGCASTSECGSTD